MTHDFSKIPFALQERLKQVARDQKEVLDLRRKYAEQAPSTDELVPRHIAPKEIDITLQTDPSFDQDSVVYDPVMTLAVFKKGLEAMADTSGPIRGHLFSLSGSIGSGIETMDSLKKKIDASEFWYTGLEQQDGAFYYYRVMQTPADIQTLFDKISYSTEETKPAIAEFRALFDEGKIGARYLSKSNTLIQEKITIDRALRDLGVQEPKPLIEAFVDAQVAGGKGA